MKKLLALVLAVLMVVTVFAGCAAKEESSSSSSSSSSAAPSGDSESKAGPYTFGYSAMTLNNPFFVYIQDTAKAVVEGKGDKFVSADPQMDQPRQISQIEDMVTQGISVLLLNPVDNKGIRPALDACQKANIPIVNFDADVYDTDMVASILVSNNKEAGYLVGQKVAKDFPDGTKLAILDSPTAKSTLDRVAGFTQALEEAGKDKYPIVYQQDGKGSTQDSLPLAENCLQANPDVGAFFAGNDPSAMGAVAALEAAGKVGEIKVYGIDGSPEGKTAIKKGQMHGTGAQSPKAIAEQSVEVAYKILAGETVEKNILVDVFLIDDTNVDQYGTDSWQ